ncbi:MAG: septum site-determining protein MinC [Hydrogenovibrio sp.]|nr:septum site-determining protein MinC [Hydrogenovibrio sp.]
MSKIIDLKGSILSLTVLHIHSEDIEQTKQALAAKVEQAPDFFVGVPVVIEPHVELKDPTFLALLVEYFYQLQLIPVGIRTQDKAIQEQAAYAGLAVFPAEKKKKAKEKAERKVEGPGEPTTAMTVNGSVRSGQQIYAKQRDLIVMGSVNPGAEIVADGHVHVFGKIMGKVFAGSAGMTEAKIFAKELNPELVCIAGMYQLSEDIEPQYKQGFVEISLKDDKLVFNTEILN